MCVCFFSDFVNLILLPILISIRSLRLYIYCVFVRACDVCVCMKEEGPSPTAVVTQLCLVYISSDNSSSKHRSPYVDVPLMAFKHVCGSACLYV